MTTAAQREGQPPDLQQAAATRVLLIDDDRELCGSLRRLLRLEGLDVTPVHSAAHAVIHATEGKYALVLLDVMLPGGDGRMILRQIRALSDVPVLMLTARGDESDRIAGLEAGADDYLPKPFNVRELVARIRAVLKRRPAVSAVQRVTVGDLELQPARRRVLHNGEEIVLTGTEFEILLLLLRADGKPVSRDDIAEACLGRSMGIFDRSVDNHISNLRRKLGADIDGAERIRSLRGVGYIYTAGYGAP